MEKYILALMPTGQMKRDVIRTSSFLALGSQYIMEERATIDSVFSLVHGTVVQFESNKETAFALWNAAKDYLDSHGQPTLKAEAIEIMPRGEFCNVFWLLAQEAGLMNLHYHVLSLLGELNLTVLGDVGELYNPHFTVARHKAGYELPETFSLPEFSSYDSLKLVLGPRGPNGKLQEVYASYEF